MKAPRGLTHGRELYGPETWLERMAAGWHELGERRAVLLVQLRPDQERDDARLSYFLDRIPRWMQVAVELRHPSWHVEDVFSMLAGTYSDADLRWWADRVREWIAGGRDVFVYFNNDGFGHAVRNATSLRMLI